MSGITMNKVEIDGHTVQLFKDEETGHITGFRFSTGKYYPDPLSLLPKGYTPTVSPKKSPEQIQEEMEEIGECPYLDLPSRMLNASTCEYFGVHVGVSELDGETPTAAHLPYRKGNDLVSYKSRLLDEKRMWHITSDKGCDLFGWKEAIESGSPKLFITEGEFDAMALWQMLKDRNANTKWKDLVPAVVSLKDGAGSAKNHLAKIKGEIDKHFKEVILVFDMDEPGQKAAKDVASIMPGIQVAELPMKDANECLIKGRPKACVNAVLFKATKPKNTRLVKGSTLREAARKKPEWGEAYPWQKLTQLTRGKRFGETRYWGAGQRLAINYVNSGKLLLGQS